METGMSEQELDRVAVMSLRRAGKISQAEAARRLGVSTRQVRRLEARLAKGGEAALRSCSRGKPSNRRTNAQLLARAMNLIREHYQGFGPTLASEYLAERHGIDLSRETLRTFMTHAKLWRPKRGPKARIHALRERRPAFGELIQIDGSFHAWFEARAPSCCLIVFIDDATSALTQLRFVERECTFAYMDALYGHVLEYGVPMALYTDTASSRSTRAIRIMVAFRSWAGRLGPSASRASGPPHPRPRGGSSGPTERSRTAWSRHCVWQESTPSSRPTPGCRSSCTSTIGALPWRRPSPAVLMSPTAARPWPYVGFSASTKIASSR